MDTYRTGRMLAKALAAFGWIVAAFSVAAFIFVSVDSSGMFFGQALPRFLAMLGGSLALVLISWMARAIFDMASGAQRGA